MTAPRWRTTLLAGVLLLPAAACGSGKQTASPTSPTTLAPVTTTAAPQAGAVIEDAGAEPRQPLVLKVTAGTTAKVAMVTKIGLQLTLDGATAPAVPTPATKTVLEERVDSVDSDGTIHYSVTFTDATVVTTSGVDAATARQVQAALDQIKGLKGTGTLDAQGGGKEFKVDTAGITEPTLKSTIDSTASQVGSLSTPFPREPVGIGARWSVKRTATLSGIVMQTTTHYTLRSRTGDRYELDLTQDAVSPPGPASIPNMPAGAQASVTNFSLQTKGQLSGDVTRPVPLKSTTTGSGDGTFTLTAGTDRRTLRQQMTLELTTSPA